MKHRLSTPKTLHHPTMARAIPRLTADDKKKEKSPGLKETIGSVLAAAFGVQSRKNRERDFKHGKARNFIVAGIVFTVLFIGVVTLVVNVVLKQARH